jgi:hypothetical protein
VFSAIIPFSTVGSLSTEMTSMKKEFEDFSKKWREEKRTYRRILIFVLILLGVTNDLQDELKREKASLRESLKKNDLKMKYLMQCSNSATLPANLRMICAFD